MSNSGADNSPIWEGDKDFGNGVRRYRCLDIASKIGQSNFEYLSETRGWRQANNINVRTAMHKFISTNFRDPF